MELELEASIWTLSIFVSRKPAKRLLALQLQLFSFGIMVSLVIESDTGWWQSCPQAIQKWMIPIVIFLSKRLHIKWLLDICETRATFMMTWKWITNWQWQSVSVASFDFFYKILVKWPIFRVSVSILSFSLMIYNYFFFHSWLPVLKGQNYFFFDG